MGRGRERKKEKKTPLCTVEHEKQNTQRRHQGAGSQAAPSPGERTPALAAYQPAGISSYSDIIPNDGALKACHLHFQSEKTWGKKKKHNTAAE